jgi:hypothetical protein
VGYERLIVTAEVVASIDTVKFIPIVRNNSSAHKVPHFLGPRLHIDFSDDTDYSANFRQLVYAIHRIPVVPKDPILPFKSVVILPAEPVRTAAPTGTTATGAPILSGAWFQAQHRTGTEGLAQFNSELEAESQLTGTMEVRLGLHNGLNKSQVDLIDAVRSSEMVNSGRQIAALFQGHDLFRPRPFGDGIRAEIATYVHGPSYDYWAVRKNGDFYLLQSLGENPRGAQEKASLSFLRRVERVTEALIFARRLYTKLTELDDDDASDTKISACFTHSGLGGRTLTDMDPLPYRELKSHGQVSETETVIRLESLSDKTYMYEEVERICAPLFMLFNFTETRANYAKIVSETMRRVRQKK